MTGSGDWIEVDDVSWVAETSAAVCVETADGREVWVPLSLGEWDGEVLCVARWKAVELGLV